MTFSRPRAAPSLSPSLGTPVRRIVIILAVALSAIPLAVKAVPAAVKASRDNSSSTVALPPPVLPEPTGTPPATTKPATTKPAEPEVAKPEPARTERPSRAEARPTLHPKTSEPKVLDEGACQASFYGEDQPTASGEAFDPSQLTAAHKTLPFGSKVKVINENNDESVVVRINDRGPYKPGRCLDLSTAAMEAIGGVAAGIIPVRFQVLAA